MSLGERKGRGLHLSHLGHHCQGVIGTKVPSRDFLKERRCVKGSSEGVKSALDSSNLPFDEMIPCLRDHLPNLFPVSFLDLPQSIPNHFLRSRQMDRRMVSMGHEWAM